MSKGLQMCSQKRGYKALFILRVYKSTMEMILELVISDFVADGHVVRKCHFLCESNTEVQIVPQMMQWICSPKLGESEAAHDLCQDFPALKQ